MKKSDRAQQIYSILDNYFPNAHCELDHANPFQLLIATILSAQCTDVRVNIVTKTLFKEFPCPDSLSSAKLTQIEKIIHSTGFYKNKAKNIKSCATDLVKNHGGQTPSTMKDLILLSGVGRKTANVVLGNAFNISEGIVVDTHVLRISKLLGLTKNTTAEKVELDLVKVFTKEQWTKISHLFIFLGRRICIANRPKCVECPLKTICPSAKSD